MLPEVCAEDKRGRATVRSKPTAGALSRNRSAKSWTTQRPEHIQSISNADEVAGFFSYLGYNITERIKQSPSNLGITNEILLKEIKKIELIANQENLLQIYLFELSSVTVANTQALVRIFRNRVGNYLLVLTSDFNRIDFGLIERVLPDDKTEGIGIKQALIRPRILTVDRLKPTRCRG